MWEVIAIAAVVAWALVKMAGAREEAIKLQGKLDEAQTELHQTIALFEKNEKHLRDQIAIQKLQILEFESMSSQQLINRGMKKREESQRYLREALKLVNTNAPA